MASRGFLIRFIDIGLIVLFGFVMISDIENASSVEIAAAAPAADEPAREQILIRVRIRPDGGFAVSAPASETVPLRGPEALEAELGRLRRVHDARKDDLLVLIQPDEASVVQRTVDVMDVCDRLALPKSLQMVLDAAPAADGA